MKYKKFIADTYENLLSLVLKKHLLNFDDDGDEDSLVMTEGTLENVLTNISSFMEDLDKLIGEEDVEEDTINKVQWLKGGNEEEGYYYRCSVGFGDTIISYNEEGDIDLQVDAYTYTFHTVDELNAFMADEGLRFCKEDADALAAESTAKDGEC